MNSRTSPYHRNNSLFVTQPNGSIRCGTCVKENVDCLVLNADDGTFEYQLRQPAPGERITTTWHPEIGAVRIVTRWMMIHDLAYEVLAGQIICAGGLALVTGWSTASIRAYGSSIPGRVVVPRRPSRAQGDSGRRAPSPLKFATPAVYDWLYRHLEPIPNNSEEFLRLLTIMSRLTGNGHDDLDVIGAYADDLRTFLGIEPQIARDDAARAGF